MQESPAARAWCGLQRSFAQAVRRSCPATATAAETTKRPVVTFVAFTPRESPAARGSARYTWNVST